MGFRKFESSLDYFLVLTPDLVFSFLHSLMALLLPDTF